MAEIKVGAIINYQGRQGKLRGVITRLDSENESCNILWEDGYTSYMHTKRIIDGLLTDETYDIENTLNAIKGKDNDTKPEIEIGMIIKNEFLCKGVVTAIYGENIHILWYDGETTIENMRYVVNHKTGEMSESLNKLFNEMM